MKTFLFLFALCSMVWFVEAIYGGKDARKGQFPHQVSIRVNGSHHCGGSILSNTTILTAAHCIRSAGPIQYVRVVVGSIYLNRGGEEYRPIATAYHRNYSTVTWAYDIALLYVQEIIFSEFVQPIKLPTTTRVPSKLIATGWGDTSWRSRKVSNVLKYLKVGTEQCEDKFSMPVSEMNICGEGGRLVGPAKGDSGGALISGEGSNAVQYGVISWHTSNYGWFAKKRYNIYTKVFYFQSWIEEYIRSDSFPYFTCFYRIITEPPWKYYDCVTF